MCPIPPFFVRATVLRGIKVKLSPPRPFMSSSLITIHKEVVVVIGRVDMVDKVFLWLDLCVSPVVVIVDR